MRKCLVSDTVCTLQIMCVVLFGFYRTTVKVISQLYSFKNLLTNGKSLQSRGGDAAPIL